mmetsp:Transcript_47347/g.111587  ORF Transcript_47347/g.111587 Transcript_47347/m.111587 type:complete len:218 (+) Transcript_47347:400-1053(+)
MSMLEEDDVRSGIDGLTGASHLVGERTKPLPTALAASCPSPAEPETLARRRIPPDACRLGRRAKLLCSVGLGAATLTSASFSHASSHRISASIRLPVPVSFPASELLRLSRRPASTSPVTSELLRRSRRPASPWPVAFCVASPLCARANVLLSASVAGKGVLAGRERESLRRRNWSWAVALDAGTTAGSEAVRIGVLVKRSVIFGARTTKLSKALNT